MERYQKAIVVGGTGLLYQTAELLEQCEKIGRITLYFCNPNGFMRKGKETIECRQVASKKELMGLLEHESQRTLVLSVMNPWIFTKEVLSNKNLLIINLHHSLLPAHRGRNAEAWAIYEGDAKAGITWHKVDAGIDTGAIYLQKEVEIDDSMTSIKLLMQLNKAALLGLEELLEQGFTQKELIYQKTNNSDFHKAMEKPNGGWLDLSWSLEQMSRFLRAMDYGILQVLGRPMVMVNDEVYVWKSWEICGMERRKEEARILLDEKRIQIYRGEKVISLKQIEQIELIE